MFQEYLLCLEVTSSFREIPEKWKTDHPLVNQALLSQSSKLLVQCHLVDEKNTLSYDH